MNFFFTVHYCLCAKNLRRDFQKLIKRVTGDFPVTGEGIKTLKRRVDPTDCSPVADTSTAVAAAAETAQTRSPNSAQQARNDRNDVSLSLGRRGSKTSSANDESLDSSSAAYGAAGDSDCNDLFDILSRDSASLMHCTDSLPRRKRRPRTAEVGDSSAATMVDRERNSSPSVRKAETPPPEVDAVGSGSLIRRMSLPLAQQQLQQQAESIKEDTIRPSSGHRRSRRTIDGRSGSPQTFDREQCIRMARQFDHLQTNRVKDADVASDNIVGGEIGATRDEILDVVDIQERALTSNDRRTTDLLSEVSGRGGAAVVVDAIKKSTVTDSGYVEDVDNSHCQFDSCFPPVVEEQCAAEGISSFVSEPSRDTTVVQPLELAHPSPASTIFRRSHSLQGSAGTTPLRQSSSGGGGGGGCTSSSSRIEAEAHLIDTKVLEFQTRQVPEREALKNRLRKLSQIYSSSGAGDDGSSSSGIVSNDVKTWPPRTSGDRRSSTPLSIGRLTIESTTSVDEDDGDEKALRSTGSESFGRQLLDSVEHLEQTSSACGSSQSSLNSSTSPPATMSRGAAPRTADNGSSGGELSKCDTDSLSSQRDEGFESASLSSDLNLSSSQRSSMCDCDAALMLVPALNDCVKDDSTVCRDEGGNRGGSPETKMVVVCGGDLLISGGGNNVEDCFARNSVDSIVSKDETTTSLDDQIAASEEPQVMTSPSMSPCTVRSPSYDDRSIVSISDAGGDRSSVERSSVSTAASVATTSSSRLRSSKNAQTPLSSSSSPSRLKPRTPVRLSSATKSGASSTTTSPAGAQCRSASAQHHRALSLKSPPSMSLSRRQSLTRENSPSTVKPTKPSTPTRSHLPSSETSRTLRKPNAAAAASNLSPSRPVTVAQTQVDGRRQSSEHFVRSSMPRTTIAAPVLRANKKAAADARSQSCNRVAAAGAASPPQNAAKMVVARSAATVRSPGPAGGHHPGSALGSTIPSPAKVGVGSTLQKSGLPGKAPGGSRIPAPGGSRLAQPLRVPVR